MQKTRLFLREALSSLIREKCYETIAVKEILDRANIGRSTFYMHYRSKDELLAGCVSEMLGQISPQSTSGRPQDKLLAFSLPILEHHAHHRGAEPRQMGIRGQAVLHEQLRNIISERVSEQIEKSVFLKKWPAGIPSELLPQYLASSFILVLNWWLRSNSRRAPKEVDAIFRSLVTPALASFRT
ncbi:MAG: TetR/AcrR family transcriptional regulator [Elusimicrobia bacterium]|nr:TetR/AcrR family transcriptional regulator [Elusimicrobiota bacterium]